MRAGQPRLLKEQSRGERHGQALPIALNKEGDEVGTGITDDNEDENSANQIAGKIPNFCVLLHGSLKVEGMVAVCSVRS